MEPHILAIVIILTLCAVLASGVWIFVTMLVVSVAGLHFFLGFSFDRIGTLLQSVQWRALTSFELAALPLFVWMAEILFRTRLSEQIFRGLAPWVSWLPGRLLHVVVAACGVFGAVCGSSAATCATISKISLAELGRRNYNKEITLGALAAGGSLGILIPPSIIMVLYAVAAEVSLLKLFAAGILPGILLMALFSAYIIGWALFNQDRMPNDREAMTFWRRVRLFGELGPVVALMAFIFIALFGGFITPTETAAWGVLGALLVAAQSRTLSWAAFRDSARATVRTSSMLVLLIAAATVMSSFMALAGIPAAMARIVEAMGLAPYGLIALLTLVYIGLGMFIDGVSMILLTLPIVLPMVTAVGFDPIWFGVFLIIVIEMGALTPPVGFNLFVLQGMTGRDVFSIGWMAMPFFVMMAVCIAIITVWPDIVMVLPDLYSK